MKTEEQIKERIKFLIEKINLIRVLTSIPAIDRELLVKEIENRVSELKLIFEDDI